MWLQLAQAPNLEPRGQLWLILIVGKVEWCPGELMAEEDPGWLQSRDCALPLSAAAPTAQCQGLGVTTRSILIRINEMNSQHSAISEGFQFSAWAALVVLGFPPPDLRVCAYCLSNVERTFTKSDLSSPHQLFRDEQNE